MEHNLADTVALLARTPAALDALLRDLPESWTGWREEQNSWSPRDVVAHLAYGEQVDWMVRARTVLQFGETQTFKPFDRAGHAQESTGKSLGQLLDEFARRRQSNLEELRALDLGPSELELRGRHPAFGTVTLSELLATWAAHDLTHLHQISRTLASRYREAVGPWSAYLGVLHCDGHGEK